jgi:3-isopropylmalate/(R)-2-methylmalate dehydratase small subunit
MAFQPITTITSSAVYLPIDHIDTDQIIPARFLKATSREGFGKSLFDGWRYLPTGEPNPEFVLNGPYGKGQVLIAGENFGCGSSREHAAWALHDYGFRAVIAKSFADIFTGNALNNGIVPIQPKSGFYHELINLIEKNPEIQIQIDLPSQHVHIFGETGMDFNFEINPFRKECLLKGTDLVDFLVLKRETISEFERTR